MDDESLMLDDNPGTFNVSLDKCVSTFLALRVDGDSQRCWQYEQARRSV